MKWKAAHTELFGNVSCRIKFFSSVFVLFFIRRRKGGCKEGRKEGRMERKEEKNKMKATRMTSAGALGNFQFIKKKNCQKKNIKTNLSFTRKKIDLCPSLSISQFSFSLKCCCRLIFSLKNGNEDFLALGRGCLNVQAFSFFFLSWLSPQNLSLSLYRPISLGLSKSGSLYLDISLC